MTEQTQDLPLPNEAEAPTKPEPTLAELDAQVFEAKRAAYFATPAGAGLLEAHTRLTKLAGDLEREIYLGIHGVRL